MMKWLYSLKMHDFSSTASRLLQATTLAGPAPLAADNVVTEKPTESLETAAHCSTNTDEPVKQTDEPLKQTDEPLKQTDEPLSEEHRTIELKV